MATNLIKVDLVKVVCFGVFSTTVSVN